MCSDEAAVNDTNYTTSYQKNKNNQKCIQVKCIPQKIISIVS